MRQVLFDKSDLATFFEQAQDPPLDELSMDLLQSLWEVPEIEVREGDWDKPCPDLHTQFFGVDQPVDTRAAKKIAELLGLKYEPPKEA